MKRTNVKKPLVLVIILGLVLTNFVAIAGASPELTEAAEDWLAINAGIGNCFATSGVSFSSVEGWALTGGTVDVFIMLQIAGLLPATQGNIIVNGKSYNDYLSETGETCITDEDILWVAAHDEGPDQYCICATPTPTPTPTPIPSTPSPTPTQTPSPTLIYTPAPTRTPTPSPISSPSPTPTLIDSDGDGVPDKYDYAPYDPNVQTKGDIKPETTPTPPQPPGFEVLFVIVGLLLVAYLIKRRKVK